MQCLGCELQKVSLYKILEAKKMFSFGLCPGVHVHRGNNY